jgi:cysteine-rich repeat protein
MRIAMSLAALAVLTLAAPVRAQVCGNGVREAPEQCDDGNTVNLDGCSATCTFEQVQRINQLALSGNPSPAGLSCTPANNRLGTQAFTSTALSQLNPGFASSVADGSTSALIYFENLSDLSGTSASGFTLGLLNGIPTSTLGYDGSSDADWWYLPDPLDIDSNRLPIDMLTGGSIAAKVLTAGPGSFGLTTLIAGAPGTLQMSSLRIKATIGPSSTPKTFDGSATQGHLLAENLDPLLTSFETVAGNAVGTGLCGNMSAASLAATPIPSAFLPPNSLSCSNITYSAANSLLDLLVSGCKVVGNLITVVNPTEPDTSDPTTDAGAPYQLIASPTTRIVDSCKDHTGAVVDLTTCLNAAAYSSYFTFTTDRVMFKEDVIFRDGFE